jgi:hypothetical protein
VDWLPEANVSEKPAVSIFRAEVTSALKMEAAGFFHAHCHLTQKNMIRIRTTVSTALLDGRKYVYEKTVGSYSM